MGRPKQYDRQDLLDRAIDLFRRQGFEGTTTQQLTDALGVNRKSMYAEFGSKQGLYEAALERYDAAHLSRVLAPIEGPDAGVAGIRRTFEGYARAAEGWARGRGCLLCNSAVERAALDPGTARFSAAYFDRLFHAYRGALESAVAAGDLRQDADLDGLAAFFTNALIGVAASVRAQDEPARIQAACAVTLSMLDLQRPTAS